MFLSLQVPLDFMPDKFVAMTSGGIAVVAQAMDTLPATPVTTSFGVLTTGSVIALLIWLLMKYETRMKTQEEAWAKRFKELEDAREKERIEDSKRRDDMFEKRIEQDKKTAEALSLLANTWQQRPCAYDKEK